jgi:hypothetical protein
MRRPAAASLGLLALAAAAQPAQAPARPDKALHDEIVSMEADDQRVRQRPATAMSPQDLERMRLVDDAHEKRMRAIVAERGWPGTSLVGEDGAHIAWLIVQHCSIDFQEACLPLLEKAAAAGQASPADRAYLLDRVLMRRGRPQVYGTQFMGNRLWVLDDPAHVDERRRSVGLGPLAAYVARMNRALGAAAAPKDPAPAAAGPQGAH